MALPATLQEHYSQTKILSAYIYNLYSYYNYIQLLKKIMCFAIFINFIVPYICAFYTTCIVSAEQRHTVRQIKQVK